MAQTQIRGGTGGGNTHHTHCDWVSYGMDLLGLAAHPAAAQGAAHCDGWAADPLVLQSSAPGHNTTQSDLAWLPLRHGEHCPE